MKHIFYSLLFFLFVQPSVAQTTYNTVKYYTGDSLHSLSIIRSMTRVDNHLFLAVNADTTNVTYGLFIVKTDMYGNKIASRNLSNDSTEMPLYPGNAILIDEDSNIVVCSNYDEKNNYKGLDGYVVKLNQNLDTIWTHVYNLPDTLAGCDSTRNRFTSIHQTPDGNYLVTAKHWKNCIAGTENERSYLVKLDKNGSVLWRQMLNYNLSYVYDLVVLPDGGFAFSEFPAQSLDWSIVRTDSLGNVIWREFPNTEMHYKTGGAIDLTHDGHIVAMSPWVYKTIGQSMHVKGANTVKYDLQGNKIWDKFNYIGNDLRCQTLHQNFKLEALNNGNILILGTGFETAFNDTNTIGLKGLSLMLNSAGDSLWSRFYGIRDFTDVCQFNDVLVMDDGGFLAAGFHLPASYGYGAWLVRMDSMGYAPGAQTVGFGASTSPVLLNPIHLDVYPNPATELIHLYWPESEGDAALQEAELSIYSGTGQLMTKHLLQRGETLKLEAGRYAPGLYSYVLHGSNRKLARGRFVLH